MKIGICGTGKMGLAIGKRLLEKGYDLSVWNRSKKNSEDLINSGAKFCVNLNNLVQQVELILVILGNDDALNYVYSSKKGFQNMNLSKKIFIEMSTTSIRNMKRLSKIIMNNDGLFIECPVGGSTGPAENGQLLGLMGGSKNLIKSLDIFFKDLFRRYEHLGDIGKGTAMKLAINLPLLVYWQALGEALQITNENQINFDKALNILVDTSGASKVAHLKINSISNAYHNRMDGKSTFDLEASLKDMILMKDEARKKNGNLFVLSQAIKYVEEGIKRNYHKEDASSITGLISRKFKIS